MNRLANPIKTIVMATAMAAVAPLFAAHQARCHVAVHGMGVYRLLVSDDDQWTNEGLVFKVNDGHIVNTVCTLRLGDRYLILDDHGSGSGKFSIHRYDLFYNYIDTPVKEYADDTAAQMALSPDGDCLYVTNAKGYPNGRVLKVDTSTWVVSVFSTDVNGPDGVCVAPDGSVYVANKGNSQARRLNAATGASEKYHALSQAVGVFYDLGANYDDGVDRVYVGSAAYSIKMFNVTDASAQGGVEHKDGTAFQNSRSFVRIGSYLYTIRQRDGSIIRFDPATGAITVVLTGIPGETVKHIFADTNTDYSVYTTHANHLVKTYASFEAAIESVRGDATAQTLVLGASKTGCGKAIAFSNLTLSASQSILATGTTASRAMTPGERRAFLADGLYERPDASVGLSYVVSNLYDAAEAYVSMPDSGVRKYVVDSSGTWREDGWLLKASSAGCQKTRACVRVGDWFYVLDVKDETGPFSIWRVNVRGRQRSLLVDSQSVSTGVAKEMVASPDGCYLYVSVSTGGIGSDVARVSIADGTVETFIQDTLNKVGDLCVSSDGSLYTANMGLHDARRYDPDTGVRTGRYELGTATGVWYDDLRTRLYVNNSVNLRWFDNESSTATKTLTDNLIKETYSLCGFGGYLYFGEWYDNRVVRFDPDAEAFVTVATGLGAHVSHVWIAALPEPARETPKGLMMTIR